MWEKLHSFCQEGVEERRERQEGEVSYIIQQWVIWQRNRIDSKDKRNPSLIS